MIEKALKSPLGYVKGCYSKGVALEGWKMVLKEGLIWIENENIGIRIRNKFTNEDPTEPDCLNKPFPSRLAPEGMGEVKASSRLETRKEENIMSEMRRAGLLGCDRSGGW